MKLSKRHFRWLPNALTISRILLGAVVIAAVVHRSWVLAFWLFYIALFTDFLDGLAAKKLDAQTKFGKELDRRADFFISACGLIALAIVGKLSWWPVAVMPVIGIFLAEEKYYAFKTGWLYHRRSIFSKIYLFSVWVYIAWRYLNQAYGWHWWYIPLTVAVLGGSALLKRHRLRAWLAGN